MQGHIGSWHQLRTNAFQMSAMRSMFDSTTSAFTFSLTIAGSPQLVSGFRYAGTRKLRQFGVRS
jgi:hypothetical protein